MANIKYKMEPYWTLAELQQSIRDAETEFYTFILNSIIDPDHPNMNVAVYANEAAPDGKIELMLVDPHSPRPGFVWSGQMFVERIAQNVAAFRV